LYWPEAEFDDELTGHSGSCQYFRRTDLKEGAVADGDLRMSAEQLHAAMARVQRLSDDYWGTLDLTCRAMDDSAWMGPAGRRFGETVKSDRKEFHAQLSKAVHSVRDRIAALPPVP
jgi:hypothetical protein